MRHAASLRVCTRSERRQSGWSVHVWSVLTHTGVATMRGTLSGTLSVWRTADARRVRAAYRQLAPPRAGLAHGACSLTAPRRHRRPHSSHTDHHRCHCQLTYLVRLESVLPTTLNAHQPAGCATHVTVATARVPSHPLQLSTACACRYVVRALVAQRPR
jgi:hypothetical protein